MKAGISGWSSVLGLSLMLHMGSMQGHAAEVSTAVAGGPQAVSQQAEPATPKPVSHLEAFSIELVMRAQAVSPDQAIYTESGPSGQLLVSANEQGRVRLRVVDAQVEQPLVDHASNAVVFDGQVHHVVLSVEQGIASLYVNGQLDSTFPYQRLAGAMESADVGQAAFSGAEVEKADLQQVTVRTQPLSADQIRQRADQIRQLAADLGLQTYASADNAVVAQADAPPVPLEPVSQGGAGGAGGAGAAGAGAGAAGAGPLSTAPLVVGGVTVGGVGAGIAAAAALAGDDSSPRSPSQPQQ